MSTQADNLAWKNNILQKVKLRTACYRVLFHKAHPVSCRLHPDYPAGSYIELQLIGSYRYSRTPSHIFTTEAELDNFLVNYT